MKTADVTHITHTKNIVRIAVATALLLMVPLVAMQFTDDVAWDIFDFAAAGALLFGTGLAYELLAKKSFTLKRRVAIGVVLLVVLTLVWAELAVGIFN